MKQGRRVWLAVCCIWITVALAATAVSAAGQEGNRPDSVIDLPDAMVPPVDPVELRGLLERERLAAGAPGAILAVQAGRSPATVVAAGHLDLQASRPMPAEQAYYLGSISKTYTAAVVLRLAAQGRLSLDDTIDRWFPEFPRAGEITVRQLLDHTNGLKDVYSYMYFRPDRDEMIGMVTGRWSETEVLDLAGRLGHWFDPGTDWSYSSTGYYLLGVIAERASGRSLPEALAEYVDEPLGLEHTWLAGHEPPRAELPEGFMGPVEGWPHSDMFGELGSTAVLDDSPVERGAGGLVAPATDAARFMSGLLRGELLEPSSLEQMQRFRDTPPLGFERDETGRAKENGYGLGLIRQVRRGVTFIGHGGLFTGHTAGSWYLPQCDTTVAFYMNRGFVGQGALLEAVAAFLVDAGYCPGVREGGDA